MTRDFDPQQSQATDGTEEQVSTGDPGTITPFSAETNGHAVTVSRRHRGESPRRQAERAVAQLHYEELLAIKAEIEAGGDAREIVRARRANRRYPDATQPAGPDLAALRYQVEDRLAASPPKPGRSPARC